MFMLDAVKYWGKFRNLVSYVYKVEECSGTGNIIGKKAPILRRKDG